MRPIINCLNDQYARLDQRSHELIRLVPEERLYWKPRQVTAATPIYSCGEHLLRSAGAVEQTFGGLATNLWDDPFEWTLPESLQTPAQVAHYLDEVEATRRRGFALFRSDDDLIKEISAPSGEMRMLCSFLVETLDRAAHYQGRAFEVFRLFSDARLPRL